MDKEIKEETGTIIDVPKEKEPLHIIQELDLFEVRFLEDVGGDVNKMICDKINEIIKKVNEMK